MPNGDRTHDHWKADPRRALIYFHKAFDDFQGGTIVGPIRLWIRDGLYFGQAEVKTANATYDARAVLDPSHVMVNAVFRPVGFHDVTVGQPNGYSQMREDFWDTEQPDLTV